MLKKLTVKEIDRNIRALETLKRRYLKGQHSKNCPLCNVATDVWERESNAYDDDVRDFYEEFESACFFCPWALFEKIRPLNRFKNLIGGGAYCVDYTRNKLDQPRDAIWNRIFMDKKVQKWRLKTIDEWIVKLKKQKDRIFSSSRQKI